MERPKIGELLVAAGVIEPATLEAALEKQRAEGGRLGKILLEMGALQEEMLVRTIARQLDMPVAWLRGKQVKAEVLAQLPGHVALKHRCLPVMLDRKGPETLLVAMEDPSDAAALDEVAIAAGRPVRVVLAAPSELDDALARHYPADPPPDAADEEPELLLTDPLGETGETGEASEASEAEPDQRGAAGAEAPAAPPAAEDPLDLGGSYDPGARPDESVQRDVCADLGAAGDADPGASAGAGPGASSDGGGADLDAGPALGDSASADLGDDLGLDMTPDPRQRAGDSLDDAIDAVRGADLARDAAEESAPGKAGPSLFGDDPLEATLAPRPARADALPRDPELRAVVLLLIERGVLSREELSERLLALGGGRDAIGS
jgi:hypothetical protein